MFSLAKATCYLIKLFITMFAWDEIAHVDTGSEGDTLMLLELILPRIHGWHSRVRHPCGPAGVAQCKGPGLAALVHRGVLPSLFCLAQALCQGSSAPELKLFLFQGVWFSRTSFCSAGDHQVWGADQQANPPALHGCGEARRRWFLNRWFGN